jgi:hypothetical protein
MSEHVKCVLFTFFILIGIGSETTLHAFDFFPSDDALDKYRQSWNPSTHGSLFIPVAETLPKGQLTLTGFTVGQIGDGQYHNTFTTHVSSSTVNTNSVLPGGILSYGLTEHISIGGGVSGIYWKATDAVSGPSSSAGLGDTSLFLTARTLVQDPETWRPSLSLYQRISLPTSRWSGTDPPPGGFEPFSIRPSTRFGALSLTEGLLVTKNFEPIRLSSALYYTYNTPGSELGESMTVYPGDLLDARVSVEHVFDEKRGLGILLGGLVRQGLPYRLDGHSVNVTPVNYSLVGISVGF